MVEFFFSLPGWVQAATKGLIAIAIIIPIAGACSMAERKISAWIQGRPGPNRAIVPWVAYIPFLGRFLQRLGVFHLMADGAKFVFKEDVVPGHVNKFYYYIAPLIALVPALTTVVVVPFGAYWDVTTDTLRPDRKSTRLNSSH
jgi:NADH-quinone oxidoreductase subunit H